MTRLAPALLAVALLAAACSSGDDAAPTTAAPPTTATLTTTTTTVPATTSVPSTTTSTSVPPTTSVPVSVPAGFVSYEDADDAFRLARPEGWVENTDFPAPGVGFLASHAALGLPPSDFSVSFEALTEEIDLAEYTAQLIDELRFFSENFELIDEGVIELAGAQARFYQFAETQLGAEVARLEVVAILGDRLVSISFTAPIETFETELGTVEAVLESFQVTTEE